MATAIASSSSAASSTATSCPRGPLSQHSWPASSAATSQSARTRSLSPVKRADDLRKLQRPVVWEALDAGPLRQALRANGADMVALFESIRDKAERGRAHLLGELKEILVGELDLELPYDEFMFDSVLPPTLGSNQDTARSPKKASDEI